MHTDLVDRLRCVREHEDSWLVAAADLTEGRHIMRGRLGCPICHTRYPIDDGIADFAGDRSGLLTLEPPGLDPTDELAIKLAAMLDIADAAGYVILMRRWARFARALQALVPIQVLAVNPTPDVVMGEGVSGVRARDRIPVAAGSAHAIAIDIEKAATNNPTRPASLTSAVFAVRQGGRIVAESSQETPDDVVIVARDEQHWVGRREGGRPLLQLVRAPGE